MVLEILADARQLMLKRNAVLRQHLTRADAGEQQQVRRIDRAATQDDFVLCPQNLPLSRTLDFDAYSASSLKNHPRCPGSREHGEVGATLCHTQKGACRTPASPAFLRHLVEADAFLHGTIEITIFRNANLLSSFNECIRQWIRLQHIGHAQWAALAVE